MDQQKAQQLYEEGLVLMKHNHHADALSCIEQVVGLDANHAEAWYRIGCCRSEIAKQKIESAEERLSAYEEFELYEGAIEAYQKAIELQPDYTSARKYLAERFTCFGEMQIEDTEYPSDYMRAIEWYKQAIEVYPGLTDSYYKLAEAYSFLMEDKEIHDWDDSILYDQAGIGTVDIVDARIEICQKLTEVQPDDAKAFYELGEAYIGSIEPYISLSEDYGNETRDEIEAMRAGKSPQIQRVLNEAIQAYRTAVGIKPDYADAYNALAKAWQWAGQFEEAIQAFKQAFVLCKFVNRETGRMACYDLETGSALHDLAEAYHALGQKNFAAGNYIIAIECYQNALKADSKNKHEVYYDLGVANDEAAHYEMAIEWYQRVKGDYHHADNYPDLLYRLGKACHRIHRYEDAVEAYATALNHQTTIALEDLTRHDSEPRELPAWWNDARQNLEFASCHEPMQPL